MAEFETTVTLIEVESGSDTLDALRRLLSAVAHVIAADGVSIDDIDPVIVLRRLPNRRVDYYRLVDDVWRYLGMTVQTMPLAGVLLAIRAVGAQPSGAPPDGWLVREGQESLVTKVSTEFGLFPLPDLGLEPEK